MTTFWKRANPPNGVFQMRENPALQTSPFECVFLGAGGGVVLALIVFVLSKTIARFVMPFFLTMSNFGNFIIQYLTHRAHHPLWGSLLVYALIGAIIGLSYHLTELQEGRRQARRDVLISIGIILAVNLFLIIRNFV
ncbi:hypothetical protein HY772_08500 [Candidatus Woesearchaeota archaeon]|nr:hypothetical protein [Candidatus Woesearchaeota archaeon]